MTYDSFDMYIMFVVGICFGIVIITCVRAWICDRKKGEKK